MHWGIDVCWARYAHSSGDAFVNISLWVVCVICIIFVIERFLTFWNGSCSSLHFRCHQKTPCLMIGSMYLCILTCIVQINTITIISKVGYVGLKKYSSIKQKLYKVIQTSKLIVRNFTDNWIYSINGWCNKRDKLYNYSPGVTILYIAISLSITARNWLNTI